MMLMYRGCFVLAFLLFSCKGGMNIKSEIVQLKSSPINIPIKMEVINQSLIDRLFRDSKNGLRLIVYTDSTSCTSCTIDKQDLWYPFLKYGEKYRERLMFYFIYSPPQKNRKKVEFALKNSRFEYPVLLDTLNEFTTLNPHLPKNKALHTFLLDENNNVVLVGDPLRNKKIREMFYEIVEEKLGKPQ